MDENGGGGGEIDDKLFQSRHLQRTKFVLTKILGQKRKRRKKTRTNNWNVVLQLLFKSKFISDEKNVLPLKMAHYYVKTLFSYLGRQLYNILLRKLFWVVYSKIEWR